MLAQYLELLPSDFNENNQAVIDVSNYDYCLVQPIGATATFETTLDSGAIQGVSDGSAISATNFTTALGLANDQSTSTSLSSSVSNLKIIKFNVVGRYIRINFDATPTKALVMLTKIS
jgi:hypothetical protein